MNYINDDIDKMLFEFNPMDIYIRGKISPFDSLYQYLKKEKEKKEREENSYIFKKYDKFVDDVVSLTTKIAIPYDELSILTVLKILYIEGFFKYDLVTDTKEFNNTALYALSGQGVCRHLACFTRDILNKIGINNEIFLCYMSDLEYCINNNSIMGKANHLANVFSYKENKYVYDIYNFTMYDFISALVCKTVNVEDKDKATFLIYKPENIGFYENITILEVKKRILEYKKCSLTPKIKKDEYDEVIKETYRRYLSKYRNIKRFTRKYQRQKNMI